MSKEKTVANRQDENASKNDAARDDAAQNGAGDTAADGAYYKSQKEVDAAFARRLEAERRKWARQLEAARQAQAGAAQQPVMPASSDGITQPAADTAQAIGAGGQPGAAPAVSASYQPLYSATAPLPSVEQPMAAENPAIPGIPQTGAPGQPGAELPAGQEPLSSVQPGQQGENPQDAAAQANPTFARIALKLLAEEADIKQVYPQFDLEKFLSLGEGVQNALLSGKSLWSVFSAVYGEALRRQAEDAALERIRDRNGALPDVLRNGGAAGSAGPDYANMPAEQFSKLRKAYEAEMRSGKKVRP